MTDDLYVLRLRDVGRRHLHPRRDDSRVCAICGEQVSITLIGLGLLRVQPTRRLVCNWCRADAEAGLSLRPPDQDPETAPIVELVVMRRADMHRIHPRQDNSRKCAACDEPVGIYPSGQSLLRARPLTRIVCNHCYEPAKADMAMLAPGAREESAESIDVSTPERRAN